jgi:hypothetical protein
MDLQPIPGFEHFCTHHCVTGSMRHIYVFNGAPISEEMLLGLGAGVGFIYWHITGALPFIGGRANVGRPGDEGLEATAGRRTGVKVASFRTQSAARAERALLESLQAGQPVMLILDMGFLPYFDFGGQEFHFGYHVVVACGYDPLSSQVLIADRDEMLHPVTLQDLAKARGSKYKPFPPNNAWLTFDFGNHHPPDAGETLCAIEECVRGMLAPPISNIGVKGIRKVARRIREWPDILSEKDLRETCINSAIMIDARGGTGGGLFRYMYGRFLEQAAALTGERALLEVASGMKTAGDQWEAVAQGFERAYTAVDPRPALAEVCDLFTQIAQREEALWGSLLRITQERTT